MIIYKTNKEIKIMQEGGRRLHNVVIDLLKLIKHGITTKEIDKHAESLIKSMGGEPSFKRVKGYFWSTCLPINNQIVHTPPSDRVLKNEELLTVDIGMYYQGFHTDFATTLVVGGNKDSEVEHFLETGKKALKKAITQARVGNYLGQVSEAIQKEIYNNGFHIIKVLTGHGIGRKLHEDPFVPCFLDEPVDKTLKIQPGLVLAIEVIYALGTEKMAYEGQDKWSISTLDQSISACFEETVAILEDKTYILT